MILTITQYYTAPDDFIFDDIKAAAIRIWSSYDDTYYYGTDKIARIKDLKNFEDNYAYIVAMFDPSNQHKMLSEVKTDEAQTLIANLIETNRQ